MSTVYLMFGTHTILQQAADHIRVLAVDVYIMKSIHEFKIWGDLLIFRYVLALPNNVRLISIFVF